MKNTTALEQILDLSEVAAFVLGESEGLTNAGEGGVEVAKHCVHGEDGILDVGRPAAPPPVT